MDIKDYTEYFETWLTGIDEEISWWKYYMENEGDLYFFGFKETVSPRRHFELEDDIPESAYGKEYDFIDVGSGPFSRCGVVSDKVILKPVAVDPLAAAYAELKNTYNLNNGVNLESGFVELLNLKYEPNSFDMVHMSNSLDHCFSAVDGIRQLINICKIGGKVILRHTENEAVRVQYVGLHQWNLSLHNEENSFIVWRENERFDICKLFADYADFELVPDVKADNEHWLYNKVIITKKKDIEVQTDMQQYTIMFNHIYNKLLYELLKIGQIRKIATNGGDVIVNKRIEKIRKAWHNLDRTKYMLAKFGFKTITIYGMGHVGCNLSWLLKECEIDAVKLDQKGENSMCFDAVTLKEHGLLDTDLIISTVVDEKVMRQLEENKSKQSRLLDIDEFLKALE